MAIINIPGLFSQIAANVDSVLSARDDAGFSVFYDFGHYQEVLKNLIIQDKAVTKKKKFPLIWLVMDFTERYGPSINGYCVLPKIDLLIAMPTKPSLSTSERINQNFTPFLYPIYEELLRQIASSSLFLEQSVKELAHEKIDRPYWGMQDVSGNGTANLFNDFIDAIQIRGLQLTVNQARCVAIENNI